MVRDDAVEDEQEGEGTGGKRESHLEKPADSREKAARREKPAADLLALEAMG